MTINANRSSVRVPMRGRLLKCSMEQIRMDNMEEILGLSSWHSMKQDVFAHLDEAG